MFLLPFKNKSSNAWQLYVQVRNRQLKCCKNQKMNLLLMFIKCSFLSPFWKQPQLPRIIISLTACSFVLIKQKFSHHASVWCNFRFLFFASTWRNSAVSETIDEPHWTHHMLIRSGCKCHYSDQRWTIAHGKFRLSNASLRQFSAAAFVWKIYNRKKSQKFFFQLSSTLLFVPNEQEEFVKMSIRRQKCGRKYAFKGHS